MRNASSKSSVQSFYSTRRHGLASVAALIMLIVVGLVCAGLLKVALGRRASLQLEERRLQTSLLVDSGLERVMAKLQTSPEFRGENWEISSEDLGGRGTALVSIEVQPVSDRADRRKVRIQADYPIGSPLKTRQSRDLLVTLSSKGPK